MKITDPHKEVHDFSSLSLLNFALITIGCEACSLGFQPEINGCCVSRGDPSNRLMIIGEAPGKHEDSTSKPFVGPAGKLLDQVWQSVGWDTTDWYVTNVCLCRPYMPRGSGKENYTPKQEQITKCSPYLFKQIELLQPKVIVSLGRTATEVFRGEIKSMGSVRGKPFIFPLDTLQPCILFPMWHPAYLLRNPNGPAKQQMWDDIRYLKQIVEGL